MTNTFVGLQIGAISFIDEGVPETPTGSRSWLASMH